MMNGARRHDENWNPPCLPHAPRATIMPIHSQDGCPQAACLPACLLSACVSLRCRSGGWDGWAGFLSGSPFGSIWLKVWVPSGAHWAEITGRVTCRLHLLSRICRCVDVMPPVGSPRIVVVCYTVTPCTCSVVGLFVCGGWCSQ